MAGHRRGEGQCVFVYAMACKIGAKKKKRRRGGGGGEKKKETKNKI